MHLLVISELRTADHDSGCFIGWLHITMNSSSRALEHQPKAIWFENIPLAKPINQITKDPLRNPKPPSLISIVAYFTEKAGYRPPFPLLAIGSLLFGLWLIIMPGFFADFLTYVLGFILTMGGVQQIASLMSARRWMPVPAGFYVVPVLILLAGLFSLFNPVGVRSTIFMVIGISAIVYACSELLNWVKFIRRRPETPSSASTNLDVSDAEIVD